MRGPQLLTAAHLICVWTVWTAALAAAPGPRFLVTAPGSIRPGGNVTIGVHLLEHSPSPVTVKAEVVKMAANDTISVLEAEGVFEKGSFKTLILPSLPLKSEDEIYELRVTGRAQDELLFSNSTRLSFDRKRMTVFVQTDKTLYKPKQEVKFRVVTLFSDFKPAKTPVNIRIMDPKSNLIQQWLSEQSDLGVISKTFQLSSHPILGDWSIQAQVNEQSYYQLFQVSEYVLPKFEVALQTPLYYSLNSKSLNGTVTAKYTYGKPVKGDVTLTFLPLSFWGMKKNITKKFKINGSANFSFNDEEMKKVMDFSDGLSEHTSLSSPGPVEILATVTESLTGISRNASSNVFFKQHEHNIDFFDYATILKPSLNFTATVKVTRFDGQQLSLEERMNNVTIMVTQRNSTEYGSRWDSRNQEIEASQILNYSVPQNGIFKIEFPILDNSTKLQLKAFFLNSVSSLAVYGVFKSPSKTYIQLKTRDENIKVGSPFELVVRGNKQLKEFSYMVISKGQLMAVGTQSSTTFSLIPENSWAPKACIIVYYIEDDGEIINDVLKIPIQLDLKNKINLFWSKPIAEPSEKVSLRISVTQPHSIVGILAVDKSVYLMNTSNDITMENVVQELELYNTGYYLGMFVNSFAVFKECGLWVLTDASLVKDSIDGVYDSISFDEEYMETNDGNLGESYDFSSVDNPRVRKYFPETWIWLDTNMGSRIYQEFEVTVPDSITTWLATAFVVSEDLGFGLTPTPVELQVFQPFFISLNLPYSVIRGEEFALEVTIFNYLKNATEVKVIIEESDKFDILMASNEVNATGHQQTILVPSEDGVTVLFPVKPTHLGEILITVTAISPAASDAITQRILVKAEGIEKLYSQSILLDLTDNRMQTTQKALSFSFPPNTVNGSERVQITVAGDILGSSISGLASLIQMPYGCGEQNMINFAPNIYVLDYLTKKKQLTESLKEKALSFMRQGDMQFWVSSVSGLSESWQPSSLDIEVAAYALLSHFLQHQVAEGIPIMRWLSRQRNSLGGFASTQDTIVALKALSEFAALMNTEGTHIQVTVMASGAPSPVKFQIDTQNRFILQTAELPVTEPIEVNISANGFGFAICQLNVFYNVEDSESSIRQTSTQSQEVFDLDVAVKDNEDDIDHLNLNVCTRFSGPERSGMALMEVNLLSGFTVPSDAIPLSETVKKVECDHGKLNLYLDSVNESQFCVDIPAVRNFKVSSTQDASVSIVDYYEPRRRAVRSYNSKAKLSSCDLCGKAGGCHCTSGAPASLHRSPVVFVSCFVLLFSLQRGL
ncbi:CD109 antigen isoform X3 [Eptesicus fuscus]|uniref:CD109 antigen isoform X3 n=1 Tax=Eptesicus fuscus TaxID=29078 RepID=UPI00240447ED|nr:CD109 antigen isoform X3 [Eptesicus fuscus]